MAEDVIDFVARQHEQVRSLFESMETATGDDRRTTFDMLLGLLAVHETAEEEVIYPAVRLRVPDGDALADARTAEEDEAKKELSELERLGVEGDGFGVRLLSFKQKVLAHAEAEERVILPALREHVDQGQREAMRAALVAAEAMAPTHPHPHAPESAVGNLVTGPVVALMDRVRDMLRKG